MEVIDGVEKVVFRVHEGRVSVSFEKVAVTNCASVGTLSVKQFAQSCSGYIPGLSS